MQASKAMNSDNTLNYYSILEQLINEFFRLIGLWLFEELVSIIF